MDAQVFLDRLLAQRRYRERVVHIRELPGRAADCAEPASGPLPPALVQALADRGIPRLYAHQAEALDAIRAGEHVVVVTGTASGKTLCYQLPVCERLLADPLSCTLMLYPTKALAQDQLRGLGAFQRPDLGLNFLAGTYDGDTPADLRRRLRDDGRLVLTNPDMLHQGILPQHARWNRFFSHLRYVVLDEVHAYRGIFGSHLANVLRRLRRVCEHYGSAPQFICSSATIANPREHAAGLTERPMRLIDRDGSPRGPKRFVLWNPPLLDRAATGPQGNWRYGGDRGSPIREAVFLLGQLVKEGIQTIAFVRTRLAAELVFKETREHLRRDSRRLADAVQAYRGGYLPSERREIEQRLARREILGVASTNALELGIDIGSLEACLLVGYPGSVASLWQQSGRAGRGREESLVILIGQNAPIDQYLMAHGDYLFARPPEQAIVDPDNPHIAVGHLRCAAHELPLGDEQAQAFGPYAPTLLDLMAEDQSVRHLQNRWYWASSDFPAANVSLRNIAGPVFTIQNEAGKERVIGTLDEISALSQLHDHAVYLHRAETYFVNKLDLAQKIAFVQKRDLDYYTQSVQTSQIRIDARELEEEWAGGLLGYGDVTVTTEIPMFKKIGFQKRDSLGFEKLELPPQELETVAMWFVPPPGADARLKEQGLLLGDALVGLANLVVEVAPLYILCDPRDIGAVVDNRNLGRLALFVHDRYPGGIGYARRCRETFGALLAAARAVVAQCACADGCPSCVGAPPTVAALGDLDTATRGRIPDKQATALLLASLPEA